MALAPMTPVTEMRNWRRDRIGERAQTAFVSGWLGTSISQYGAIPDADSNSRLGQLLRLHELKYPTTDTRFPNGVIAHGHTTRQGTFIYGQPVPALMAWRGDVGTRSWYGRGGSGTAQSQLEKRWMQVTGATSVYFWVYTIKDTDAYEWYLETRDANGKPTSKTPVGNYAGGTGTSKKWHGHKFSNLNPNQTYFLVVEWTKGYNMIFDGGDELRGTESKAFRFINMHKSGSSARGFAGNGMIDGVGIPFLNVHMMSDDEVSGLHELNISMGTNEQASTTFADDLLTIIDWVRVRNKTCRIWLHLEGQPQGCSEATWRYMKDQHDLVASKRLNVAVTPTSSLFTVNGIPQWTAGGFGSEFMYGPLHPNPDGYARYAAVDFANLTGSAVLVPEEPVGTTPGDDVTAPIITVIDPTESAVLGTNALFTAKATDAGSGVAKLELILAGTNSVLATLTRSSGTAADGTYTVTKAKSELMSAAPSGDLAFRATDVKGNKRDKPFGVNYGTVTAPGEPTTKLTQVFSDSFNRTAELKGSKAEVAPNVWLGEAGQYRTQGAVVEPVLDANGNTVASKDDEMGVRVHEDAGINLNGQWDTSLRISTAPGTRTWRTQVIFLDGLQADRRGRIFLDVTTTSTTVNAGIYWTNYQTGSIEKIVDLPGILDIGKSDQYLVVRMVITATTVQVSVASTTPSGARSATFSGAMSLVAFDTLRQSWSNMSFSNDNPRFRMDYLTANVQQEVVTGGNDTTGPMVQVVRPLPDAVLAYGAAQDFVFKVTDVSKVGASRLVIAQPSGTPIGTGTPTHLTELGEEYYGHIGVPYADLAALAVNGVLRWTAAFRDASDANNGQGNRTEVGGFNLTVTPAPVGTTPTPDPTFDNWTFVASTEFGATEVSRTYEITLNHPQGIEYAAVYAYGSGGQPPRVASPVRVTGTNVWRYTVLMADIKSSNRMAVVFSSYKAPNDTAGKSGKTEERGFTFANGVDTTAPMGTQVWPVFGTNLTEEVVPWRVRVTDADSGATYVRILVGIDTEVLELKRLSGSAQDGIWGADIRTEELQMIAPKGISLRPEMTDAAGNVREGTHIQVTYPTPDVTDPGFAKVYSEPFRFQDPVTEAGFTKRLGTGGGGGGQNMFAVDTDGVIYLSNATGTNPLFGIDTDGTPYSL